MILFVERKEVNQKKARLMILFVERKEVNQKKTQLMMTPVRNVQGFLGDFYAIGLFVAIILWEVSERYVSWNAS